MTFNNLSVELTSFDLAKKFLLKEFYKLPLRISLLKIFFKKIFFQKLTFYVNFIIIITFIFQPLKQHFSPKSSVLQIFHCKTFRHPDDRFPLRCFYRIFKNLDQAFEQDLLERSGDIRRGIRKNELHTWIRGSLPIKKGVFYKKTPE